MNFKYYDILSTLITGYIALIAIMYSYEIKYNNEYTVAYLSLSFLCGYIINTLGGLLEPFYYVSIGGKPSSRLLQKDNGNHNFFHELFIPSNKGLHRVRFYESDKVRDLLSNNLEGDISEDRLFLKAMREVNCNSESRINDFNAHYAFARNILTTVIISCFLIIPSIQDNNMFCFLIILLILCWYRYKERAYYFAREVLNEYLKLHSSKTIS